jgi:NDP-sugar pyrophosphorylase family protein
MVEPEPLGTGGAIKFASRGVDDTVLVFNGDVLTQTNLNAVIRHHRMCSARATIVLTPVSNPSAYGLVETDQQGNVRRFVEKPALEQITCNTINAGIYILEPETFDRIPDDVASSIERDYFPSLVNDGERFVSYVEQGYWLDIGSPSSYVQAHRDLMFQRCSGSPFDGKASDFVYRGTGCKISSGAELQGPCFLGTGCLIESGARIGPQSVIGPRCIIRPDAVVERGILWSDTIVESRAMVNDAVVGENCKILSDAKISSGAVIGHRTVLSEYSRV